MAANPVASVGRRMQLGPETTEGTDAAADIIFSSVMFDLRPRVPTEEVRAQGYYIPSGFPVGYDYSEGSISGRLTYSEAAYLFASYFSYTAPAQQGGTAAYLHAHGITPTAADTHKTYTVEVGYAGSAGAQQAVGVVVNELSLECSRASGMVAGGAVMGRTFTQSVAFTTGAAVLPFDPVLGKHMDIYLDTSWANLGNTQLEDVVAVSLNFGARYAPFWPMNSSLASYGAKVGAPPGITATMRMAANATGRAYLDALRAGTLVFLRVEATGDEIASPYNKKITLDLAMQYTEGAPESDDNNALVLEAPLGLVVDPTSGNAFEGSVINTLTAL